MRQETSILIPGAKISPTRFVSYCLKQSVASRVGITLLKSYDCITNIKKLSFKVLCKLVDPLHQILFYEINP
jgi:hypothetical protein